MRVGKDALGPEPTQERRLSSTMGGMLSGPLALWTSRDRRALRTDFCVNWISGMEFLQHGITGGGFSPSSNVEFDAKRVLRRLAFPFASWANESSSLRSGGNDGVQKFPLTALARDQKARVPDGSRASLSPILPICSAFAMAIALLRNLEA